MIRGKWVLDNVLGTPRRPRRRTCPRLDDNTVSASLPAARRSTPGQRRVREDCHDVMDPVGLSLENFDAVGRWRTAEEGRPVDAAGGLPDGSRFAGVDGLEAALLKRPEIFTTTLAEKLLTFALGRGVGHYDGPAVRGVVRAAAAADYRFSAIVVGIVHSTPFRMRETP